MAERVIVGYRSDIAQTALWVSAPGKSARSANKDDLLVDHEIYNNIYILKGYIPNPTLTCIADTHSTGSTFVCDAYNGSWGGCSDYYYPGAQYHYVGNDWLGNAKYQWCTFYPTTCASGHAEQTVNNGVSTWEYKFPHNLGYTPRSHISVQANSPSTPVPQVFIDTTHIILRYYEMVNGAVAGGYALWGDVPTVNSSTMTFGCTIHYSLFARGI
jgi:hypothetical protein